MTREGSDDKKKPGRDNVWIFRESATILTKYLKKTRALNKQHLLHKWNSRMKKIIGLSLLSFVFVALMAARDQANDHSTGSLDTVIKIHNCDQLQRLILTDNLARHYKLADNIDCSGENGETRYFTPIGTSGEPFTGAFDGNGFIIKNLTIDSGYSSGISLLGLFGHTKDATLNKVILENVIIHGHDSLNAESGAGALVGKAVGTNITSSHVKIAEINHGQDAGGLIGLAIDTNVSESSAQDVNMTGKANLGGLIGRHESGKIIQNYVTNSTITGDQVAIGGLVGHASNSYISQSYVLNNTTVSGGDYIGGLVGYVKKYASSKSNSLQANSTIENCYTDVTVKGHIYAAGIAGYITDVDIKNTYAVGYIHVNQIILNDPTGIVGSIYPYNPYSVTGSYWLDHTGNAPTEKDRGIPITDPANMKLENTFVDWDFEKVWSIDEGNSYPQLRWTQ